MTITSLFNSSNRIILFLLFMLTFYLISCSKDNSVSPDENESSVQNITGNLNGWNWGSDKKVMLIGTPIFMNGDIIHSVSQIDSNGSFSFNSLESPAENFLNPLYPDNEGKKIICNTITSSDPSARMFYGCLAIFGKNDPAMRTIGSIYKRNYYAGPNFTEDSIKQGDFGVNFVYANKDVHISGIFEYESPVIKPDRIYHYTLEYNLFLKKGWNKEIVYYKSNYLSNDSGSKKINITIRLTNKEPAGARWVYDRFR